MPSPPPSPPSSVFADLFIFRHIPDLKKAQVDAWAQELTNNLAHIVGSSDKKVDYPMLVRDMALVEDMTKTIEAHLSFVLNMKQRAALTLPLMKFWEIYKVLLSTSPSFLTEPSSCLRLAGPGKINYEMTYADYGTCWVERQLLRVWQPCITPKHLVCNSKLKCKAALITSIPRFFDESHIYYGGGPSSTSAAFFDTTANPKPPCKKTAEQVQEFFLVQVPEAIRPLMRQGDIALVFDTAAAVLMSKN